MLSSQSPHVPGDPRKAHASAARQRLILLMQRLSFGTIHDLHIRAGDPVLIGMLKTVFVDRGRKNQ